MITKIHIKEGNTLTLNEAATKELLKSIHNGNLNNSLPVFHFTLSNSDIQYSIPICNVLYIEYIEGE